MLQPSTQTTTKETTTTHAATTSTTESATTTAPPTTTQGRTTTGAITHSFHTNVHHTLNMRENRLSTSKQLSSTVDSLSTTLYFPDNLSTSSEDQNKTSNSVYIYIVIIGVLSGLFSLSVLFGIFISIKYCYCHKRVTISDDFEDGDSDVTEMESEQIYKPRSMIANKTYLEPCNESTFQIESSLNDSSENIYTEALKFVIIPFHSFLS